MTSRGERQALGGHVFSYAVFIIGLLMLITSGLVYGEWLYGVVLVLLAGILGLYFYRRGR